MRLYFYFKPNFNKVFSSEHSANQVIVKLNNWCYYVTFVVLISWIIDYTSKFYAHTQLARFMLSSAKSGVPSLQVYGWRCSGTYYFETACDLELQVDMWEEEDFNFVKPTNIATGIYRSFMLDRGSTHILKDNKGWSGYYINCSPGHAEYIKNSTKLKGWDGSQPVHISGQICGKGKNELD